MTAAPLILVVGEQGGTRAALLSDALTALMGGDVSPDDVAETLTSVINALGLRLRLDAPGQYTDAQREQGRANLDVPAVADLQTLLSSSIARMGRDPGPTDVPTDTVRVIKNTATGRISIWANDGGVIVDLLLLST